jgi:5-amino-6-(5-phospho-D-ribitylamino)uracil phosphatase
MYKALISDVDGTLIPNKKDGLPSPAVIDAIIKSKDLIHVGIATSRPLFMLTKLFEKLPLSGPCVVSGGTQIYDATTKKVVWEKRLEVEKMEQIIAVMRRHFDTFYINDGVGDTEWTLGYRPKPALGMFAPAIEPEEVQRIHDELLGVKGIAVHQIASHTPGKIDLDITHGLATKQHGVLEVAKILDIDSKEIIGVGDGYNDFPLLMACGLKVAMGNAVEDLKAIADYIAPTVDEDGVADVINRFVLNEAPSLVTKA